MGGDSNTFSLRSAPARETEIAEEIAEETTNYSSLTVSEIKEELNKRGISYSTGMNKAALIELLENDDKEKKGV